MRAMCRTEIGIDPDPDFDFDPDPDFDFDFDYLDYLDPDPTDQQPLPEGARFFGRAQATISQRSAFSVTKRQNRDRDRKARDGPFDSGTVPNHFFTICRYCEIYASLPSGVASPGCSEMGVDWDLIWWPTP
ncbi:MAG: hypothetical protein ACOX52_05295 [Verrucomicrobiota bacterium]|jgi:hypothetical protein